MCNKKDLRRRGELTTTVCREIAIIKALRHRNLVGLRQVHSSKNKLYIVTDLVDGGCAFDRLLTLPAPTVGASSDLGGAPARGISSGGVPEADARALFIQLAAAIAYCHRRGVAHRCLKPENLLLGPGGRLLISDLAVAALHGAADASELFITSVATPNYVAPELIVTAAATAAAVASGKTRAPGGPAPEGVNEHGVVPPPDYSPEAVDAWSSGVILYTLLAGFLPWDAPSVNGVLTKITAAPLQFPPHVPSPARHLLRQLLDKNPASRADLRHVLHHPWCLAGPPRELGTPVAPSHAASVTAASATTAGVAAAGNDAPTADSVVLNTSAKPDATAGSSPPANAVAAVAGPRALPPASDEPVKRSVLSGAKTNGPRRRPSRKSQSSVTSKPVSTSKAPTDKLPTDKPPTDKPPTDKNTGKETPIADSVPRRASDAAMVDAAAEPVKLPASDAPKPESPSRDDKSAVASQEPEALQERVAPQELPAAVADPVTAVDKNADDGDPHSRSPSAAEDQGRPADTAAVAERAGTGVADVTALESTAAVAAESQTAVVTGTSNQKWRKRLEEQDLGRLARKSKPGQRPKRPTPVVLASEGSGAEEDDLDVTVVSSADAVNVDLDIVASSSAETRAAQEPPPAPAVVDSPVEGVVVRVQDAVDAIRQLRQLISRTTQMHADSVGAGNSDDDDDAFVDAVSSPEKAAVHELVSPTSATCPKAAGQDGGIRPVAANIAAGDNAHGAPGQSRLPGQSAKQPGASTRILTQTDFHRLLRYAATGSGTASTEATSSPLNGHPGRGSGRARSSGLPASLMQPSGAPWPATMAQALSTVRTALTGSPKLSSTSLAAVEHVLDAWQGALARPGSADDLDARSAAAMKLGDTVSDADLSSFQALLSQCLERLQAWADGGGSRDVLSPEKLDALVSRRSGDHRGRPLIGGKAPSIASTLPSPGIRGKFIGGAFSIERGPRMSRVEPGGVSAGDDGSELSEDDEVVAVDFGDDALFAEEISSGSGYFMDAPRALRPSNGEPVEQPRLFINLSSDGETRSQRPSAAEAEQLQLDDVFSHVDSPAPIATSGVLLSSRQAPPSRGSTGSMPSASSGSPSTTAPVASGNASGSAAPVGSNEVVLSADSAVAVTDPTAARRDSNETRPGEGDLRERSSNGANVSAKQVAAVADAPASTSGAPSRGPGAVTFGSADDATCGAPFVGYRFLSSLAPVRCLNEVGRLLATLGCDVVRKRGEFKLRCSASRPDGVLAASVEIAPVTFRGGSGDGGASTASSASIGGALTPIKSSDGEPRSAVTFRRSQKTEVPAPAFVAFFDAFFDGLAHAVGGSARPSADLATAAAAADASPVGP